MNKAENYLRKADFCRRKAMAQINPESAEMWRQMATSYEDLARGFFIYNRLRGVEPAE
jgi:hypothetical protein